MKPFALSLFVMYIALSASAQERAYLVKLDTLCDAYKLDPDDFRITMAGRILHVRCKKNGPEDYFLIGTATVGLYRIINKGGRPLRKAKFFSTKDNCWNYVYIDTDDGRYTYHADSDTWTGPSKVPDPRDPMRYEP